jgi:hypothetical protein
LLAESAWLSLGPFSVIAHKTVWIGLINIDDLYGSLPMPHTVFEFSKVKVFFRDVFEAEAILITFTWKVSLPLSEIKGAMEIPHYIFIRF